MYEYWKYKIAFKNTSITCSVTPQLREFIESLTLYKDLFLRNEYKASKKMQVKKIGTA